jgi:hypothetical protein
MRLRCQRGCLRLPLFGGAVSIPPFRMFRNELLGGIAKLARQLLIGTKLQTNPHDTLQFPGVDCPLRRKARTQHRLKVHRLIWLNLAFRDHRTPTLREQPGMPRKLLILRATIVGAHVRQELILGVSPAGTFVANILEVVASTPAAMCFRASRRPGGRPLFSAETFYAGGACPESARRARQSGSREIRPASGGRWHALLRRAKYRVVRVGEKSGSRAAALQIARSMFIPQVNRLACGRGLASGVQNLGNNHVCLERRKS